MIRVSSSDTHDVSAPVKNTPLPYGGEIIYPMIVAVVAIEPENPSISTPSSIVYVLYGCI